MPSMVWHVLLPGTHTVTVVNRVLTLSAGPPLTTTLTTFDEGVVVPDVPLAPDSVPPPPPPQDMAERQTSNPAPRTTRITAGLTGGPLWTLRLESRGASRRVPSTRACARWPEPRDSQVQFANDGDRRAWPSPPSHKN